MQSLTGTAQRTALLPDSKIAISMPFGFLTNIYSIWWACPNSRARIRTANVFTNPVVRQRKAERCTRCPEIRLGEPCHVKRLSESLKAIIPTAGRLFESHRILATFVETGRISSALNKQASLQSFRKWLNSCHGHNLESI